MKKAIAVITLAGIILCAFLYAGSDTISIIAVGDILLDRGVRRELTSKSYAYPYEKTADILKSADITFGNLECPLSERGTPIYKRPDIIFRADVENAAELRKAGFDILNIANNHTMDYGSDALLDTIEILKGNNIIPLGAGENKNTAHKPIFKTVKGVKLGFLGYSLFPPEGYINLDEKPDVSKADINTLAQEVSMAKKSCDFLVVSFHWGKEYEYYAGDLQKSFAYKAIESGADLIFGHHPHVLQGIEEYKEKLIFYGLGNFIFDRQLQNGTDESVIAEVIIKDKKVKTVELIPVKIVNAQPVAADSEESQYILERLMKYSKDMRIDMHIDSGKGYLKLY